MSLTPHDEAAPTIRDARATDARALAQLSDELGYPTTEAQLAARLTPIVSDAEHSVLVAEADGAIVGWIHVSVVPSLESVPFVEIRGLIVTDQLRRKGIGSALVARAERWARGLGYARIRVRCREERAEAHRFYLERGYACTKTQRAFDKRLDDASRV